MADTKLHQQNEIELTERDKIEAVLETSAFNQKNPLEESERCLYGEDCVEFYAILNKEMKAFIARKFSLAPRDMNLKNLANTLDKAAIDNETSIRLQHLMQEIEFQLYTPFVQTEKRNELYSRSQEIIQEINIAANLPA